MLAPVLMVVVGLFGAGLGAAFLESIGAEGANPAWTPTAEHYLAVLRDREFRAALGLTFWIATATTLVSTVLGIALALILVGLVRGRQTAYVLLQVPLGIPHLAIAVGFVTLLAPSGWVARGMFALGLIGAPSDFPALVYDGYGIGIILAYVVKEAPFVAVVSSALLLRLDEEYLSVARTLGASSWQQFRHVTWPLIAPGVASAALMVFAFVFAAFDTPFLLGRPYPSMLSVVAQRRYLSIELADRPVALAMALIMTALAASVVWAYVRMPGSSLGRERPAVF